MQQDFNREVYNELVDESDPTFAPQIARQWIEQARDCLPEFRALLGAKNWKDIADKGHFIKGSAAFVGAERAKEVCEQIQNYGQHLPNPDDNPYAFLEEKIRQLPAIIDAYERVLQTIA
jgi:HPt (histidine-containing phosphotransfer) domain-containing protein